VEKMATKKAASSGNKKNVFKQHVIQGTMYLQHVGYQNIKFKINKEFTFIGRIDDNDFAIPLEGISDRHAFIFHKEGNFYLVDLKSRLGTTHNEKPVVEPVLLNNGDQVAFDRQLFGVVNPDQPAAAPVVGSAPVQAAAPAAAAVNDDSNKTMQVNIKDLSNAHFVIDKGPEKGEQLFLSLTGKNMIARKAISEDAIVIDDSSISRNGHCSIVKKSDGWHIKDNKSTNGVVVNDNAVTETVLFDGAIVKLGDVTLSFHDEESAGGATIAITKEEKEEAVWEQKTIIDDGGL